MYDVSMVDAVLRSSTERTLRRSRICKKQERKDEWCDRRR